MMIPCVTVSQLICPARDHCSTVQILVLGTLGPFHTSTLSSMIYLDDYVGSPFKADIDVTLQHHIITLIELLLAAPKSANPPLLAA